MPSDRLSYCHLPRCFRMQWRLTKGFCGCCDICPVLKGPYAKETDGLKASCEQWHGHLRPSLLVCTSGGFYAPKQCRGSRVCKR
ncbi:hypothetical protein CHS0354_016574 [Potamilus streckersoni]|uniref:Uncharacterized protein n=1 Tax=Potamilus streckersoni TaxID=2493646 RepID=A0AAE0TN73_9BIVA|nr:hypothetical protein CHS0354_016574 [Potamilus streckersoni]